MTKEMAQAIRDRCGFMTEEEVAALAVTEPRRPLLIRFGNGREVVAARDVKVAIALRERDHNDFVRDVSIPAGDPFWKDQ